MLLALAAFVFVTVAVPSMRTWTTVGLGVATTFAAALVGKAIGVVVARLRLRRDIRRIKARLAAGVPG